MLSNTQAHYKIIHAISFFNDTRVYGFELKA